jgi:YVTN family beta-propeller protein
LICNIKAKQADMKKNIFTLIKTLAVLLLLSYSHQKVLAQCSTPVKFQAYSFCNSGTFTVGSTTRTVNTAGIYTYMDTLLGAGANGCDSIVETEVAITNSPAPAPQVSNRVLCNGDTSSKISFNLPDNSTYVKWHSSNPNIGLKYMGVDTIPQFVAINNGTTPIIDTIRVVVKNRGFAWIPAGNKMYKYDLTTRAVIDSAIIPFGIVHSAKINHAGTIVYAMSNEVNILNAYGFSHLRYLFAFSTATGKLLKQYELVPELCCDALAGNIAISPDDQYVYVSSANNSFNWRFFIINTITHQVQMNNTGILAIYNATHGEMCISPDGTRMYVNARDQGIQEFALPSVTYLRTLTCVQLGYSIAMAPDGKRLFVTSDWGVNNLRVVDIAADTIITNITTFGGFPYMSQIKFSSDSSVLIVGTASNYPNATETRYYLFDANNYSFKGNTGSFAALGYLPGYDVYYITGSNTSFINFFVTPDGRDIYSHQPLIGSDYFGLRRQPFLSTIAPTPLSVLGYHSTNKAGSLGDLAAPGPCESEEMIFTITVNPTARDTQQITICPGTTFTAGNHTYNTTGIYRDTIPNGGMYSCDSIIVTNLTVLPYPKTYQAFTLCAGGSITVGTVTHSTTGYYADTLHNVSTLGCDSIVFTNLTVGAVPAAPAITLNNQTVCAGANVPATTLGSGIQWAGSTTAIGLAASGSATVPAFTAINNGNTPVTDTISVTTTAPGFAYVSNPNFSQVAVINRQTNSVVTNIGGLSGASGVAVNPAATRVYVGSQNTNNVYVLNPATNTLSATIPVGTQPFNVAVNPAGNRVYAANSGSHNVMVIDTLTNTVIDTIPVGTNPRGIAVHPNGELVYVANSGSDNVSVINTLTDTVIATIPVGDNPFGLAINAAGTRVYTANFTGGTVSVINVQTNTLIATITVGNTPRGIAVTPDGTKVYVPNFLTSQVYVINATNNTVSATINVGNRPTGVSVSADGSLAYVTNSLSGSVSVISTATNTVVNSITGMPGPDCLGNFTSGSGCSSAPVQYLITVNPKPQYTQQVSLCAGSSITVGSHTYNASGTYTDTLANASVNGCDSIVTTQLTINNPVATTITTTICQGNNYAGHTSTGTYTDTYSNVNGCDSVRTLNLTVAPVYNTNITANICQGGSYEGYTATGIYTDNFTSIAGCDSTRVLNLTVHPNYTNTTTATICGNQVPYTWNGQPYYFTGIYTANLTSINGCDSTEILDLTVNPATTWWRDADGDGDGNQFVDSVSCAQPVGYVNNSDDCNDNDAAVNSSLVWYIDMDADGYGSTAQVYNGCDPGSPIFVLDSTDCDDFDDDVHATFTFYVDNDGDTYGSSAQATLCAVDANTPPAGYEVNSSDCNDALFNATSPQSTSSITNLDVCQNALPYTWNGLTFNSAGSQTATGFINAAGCDSTATLNLTLLPSFNTTVNQTILFGNTYNFYGNILSAAGTYTHTLTAGNGCDSVITLNLTVQSAGITLTWTGAVSQDWQDANNWSPALVPVACSQDVQIPVTANQPIVAGAAAYVNNITLADGAIITLQNQPLYVCGNWMSGNTSGSATANVGGGEVVLNGATPQTISGHTNFQVLTLNNNDGAMVQSGALVEISEGLHLQTGNLDNQGEVVLLSPDELKAAYLDDFSAGFTGYLSGNITVQRGVGGSGTWQHFISSPVNTPAINDLTALSGPNGTYVTPSNDCSENLLDANSATGIAYEWVEAALVTPGCFMGNWMIRSTGSMYNGHAYSMYLSSGVYSLTSAPNRLDVIVSGLSNSNWSTQSAEGNTFTSGWHLLGNPYPSPVELDVNHAITEGFDAQVQVWMPNGPWQGTWDARLMGVDAQLASSQGFQVHNSNVGTPQTFTFTDAERRRTSVVNPSYFQMPNQNALNVIVEGNNGRRDRTRVYFNTDATVNFDQLYDADKLISTQGYPTVYTWMAAAPERRMGINTLTDINTTSTVPMAFIPGTDGSYTVTAEGINTFDPTSYIMLEDILTGTMHNLRNGGYTFTSSVTDARNRFVLHFTPAAEINTTASSCANDGVIIVSQPGSAVWNYSVSNTQGTILSSGVLNQGSPATVNNLSAGVYTLTLTDNNGYTVVKNIQVTGPASVNPTFVAPATATVGQNITFNNTTTGAVSYVWDMGDGTTFSGIASPQYSYDNPGQYTVTLTTINADGCSSSFSQTVTVAFANGIGNIETANLNIYGAGNKVYVDFSKLKGVEATIEIYNVIGQNLSTEKFGKSSIYAKEIKNLDAAYVIVKVINNGEITTKKVFMVNSK